MDLYSPPQCASWPPASRSPCCCPASPSSHRVYRRETQRLEKKNNEKWFPSFQTPSPNWVEPDYPKVEQEMQTCFFFFFSSSKRWKFIKVREHDPEMIPFEVRNSSGKIWKALKVRLVKKNKIIGTWHNLLKKNMLTFLKLQTFFFSTPRIFLTKTKLSFVRRRLSHCFSDNFGNKNICQSLISYRLRDCLQERRDTGFHATARTNAHTRCRNRILVWEDLRLHLRPAVVQTGREQTRPPASSQAESSSSEPGGQSASVSDGPGMTKASSLNISVRWTSQCLILDFFQKTQTPYYGLRNRFSSYTVTEKSRVFKSDFVHHHFYNEIM